MSPLVHGKLELGVPGEQGSVVYKDVKSEEDMLQVVGRVMTSVRGLRYLAVPLSKCNFINAECLRVISNSFRFLKMLFMSETEVYYRLDSIEVARGRSSQKRLFVWTTLQSTTPVLKVLNS